jgi:hypothetical protein
MLLFVSVAAAGLFLTGVITGMVLTYLLILKG